MERTYVRTRVMLYAPPPPIVNGGGIKTYKETRACTPVLYRWDQIISFFGGVFPKGNFHGIFVTEVNFMSILLNSYISFLPTELCWYLHNHTNHWETGSTCSLLWFMGYLETEWFYFIVQSVEVLVRHMNLWRWMVGLKLTHVHELNKCMRITSKQHNYARERRKSSFSFCLPSDRLYRSKGCRSHIYIVVLFLHGNNMDTYYYSRYVDLYILYHTDGRVSFLMKTPKGGLRQELHSVQIWGFMPIFWPAIMI